MKIKCIAIDDEPPALDLIKNYIKKTPFLELVDSCNSALDILEKIDPEYVDLIFMDIEMPDLSGMNLSKIVDKKIKIIFITAYDQYAIEGYKVEALDYLLKPLSYEEFLEAAQKAKEYLQLVQTASDKTQINNSSIFVRSDYKLIKVRLDNILFIEGMKDYVKFHLESAKHPLVTLVSLKKLEQDLPRQSFLRVHRSFIVNLDKIQSIERRNIILKNATVRLGDQYSEELLKRIHTA